MFSVGIELAGEPAGETSEANSTNRNPGSRFSDFRGVLHLYRNSTPSSFSSSRSSSTQPPPPPPPSSIPRLPDERGTHLLILAVPGRFSLEDFESFCGKYIERAIGIWVVRNDAIEDRYSVLVEFEDQMSTDEFYREINGWRFTSEGEVCHALFIGSVECTECTDTSEAAMAGLTELPTCPVCIERLNQKISGIIPTNYDNTFQCSSISKWVNSSCSVCQFCQKDCDKPTCSICGTSQNLSICVTCGFVGCGRYKGHAERHWKDTQHCYSLDWETQRIWDYVGCSDESGMDEDILQSKIEVTKDEYTSLLATLLEFQKQYYENLIQEKKDKKVLCISEAVQKAVNSKMRDIQLLINEANRSIKTITTINEKLEKDQNLWRKQVEEIEVRESATLKMMDEKIHSMEEDVLDYTFFIEFRKKLDTEEGRHLRDGTTLTKTAPPPSSGDANISSRRRSSRRRR